MLEAVEDRTVPEVNGLAWFDLPNGAMGPGLTAAGVVMTLTPATGTPVSVISANTGVVSFGELAPGSYAVAVTPPPGYSVGAGGVPGTVTVGTGDEIIGIGIIPTLPVVTVEKITDATENGDPGTFRLTRTGDASQSLTIFYTVGGTATPGTDYTTLPGSAMFAAGASTVDVPVTTIDDNIAEPAESVDLTLSDSASLFMMSGGPSYTVGTPGSATVTITDDEPVVSVYSLNDAVEGDAASKVKGTFRFVRTGNLSQPLSAYFTVGGTATAGIDYAAPSGGVLFPAGQDAVEVTIDPEDDGVLEGVEYVDVSLVAWDTYTRGERMLAAVNIFDAPPAGGGGNPGVIGGIVWTDDGDGVRTIGEARSIGWAVTLRDEAGNLLFETQTDAAGSYQFRGLAEGTYFVLVQPPLLYWFTTPNVGSDEATDSDIDPSTGQSGPITLVPGAMTNLTEDAGFAFADAPPTPVSASDRMIFTRADGSIVAQSAPLRVAKWNDAFEAGVGGTPQARQPSVWPGGPAGNGFDFIDRDKDRFNSTALVFPTYCPCGCCVWVSRSGQRSRRMVRGSQSL